MSRLPQEPFSLLRDRVRNKLIFFFTCLVRVGKRCRLHEVGLLIATIGHLRSDETKVLFEMLALSCQGIKGVLTSVKFTA